MKTSLQSRIAMTMWLLITISTMTATVLTGGLLIRSHRDSIHRQLETAATSLISLGISNSSELEDFDQLNTFIEETLEMEKVDKIIRIYDPSGKIVFTTAGIDYDRLPDHLDTLVKKPIFVTLEGRHRKYESLIVPYLVGQAKKKAYYLQVVIPLPRYPEIFESLWWKDLILLALLVSVSLFLARRLSQRLLSPVVLIADHLQKMDPNRTSEWKPLQIDPHKFYLEDIVHGLNSLTERTRKAVLQIRKMSRYVAHELRTPLTILQGEAETVLSKKEASREDYEHVIQSSLEEIQRMSETVSTVLQVGEWERTSSSYRPVPCQLVFWLRENQPRWEKTLGHSLHLSFSDEGKMTALVDPSLFYHLIDNLVRNIRDHTKPGTPCQLSVATGPSGPTIKLSDEGQGLPQNLLDSLNRGEDPLEKAGVGLTLCRQIAEICHLRLHFSNRPQGGLVVDIHF